MIIPTWSSVALVLAMRAGSDAAISGEIAPIAGASAPLAINQTVHITEEADGSRTLEPVAASIFVARITPDGQSVVGCIDSQEAARQFLRVPAEQLPRQRRGEQ